MNGASAVPAMLIRRTVKTLGCGTTILFGQTEMTGAKISQTKLTDSPQDQAETVGSPCRTSRVKIADLVTGDALPVGEQARSAAVATRT